MATRLHTKLSFSLNWSTGDIESGPGRLAVGQVVFAQGILIRHQRGTGLHSREHPTEMAETMVKAATPSSCSLSACPDLARNKTYRSDTELTRSDSPIKEGRMQTFKTIPAMAIGARPLQRS